MTPAYLAVALLYALFALAVLVVELRRTRGSRADATSIFVALALLQCCLPAIALYAMLPFVNPQVPTGNGVLDRILQSANPTSALLVLAMTVWFIVFFYASLAVGRLALGSDAPARVRGGLIVSVSPERLLLVLTGGLGLTLLSFWLLGDNLLSRYANLILLRAGYEGIERNALNANAFSLTQTWSWLSVLALFCVRERWGRRWLWWICLVTAVIFAALGASRRGLFLPLVLGYLTLVLHDGRWRLRWIVGSLVPLVLLIAFGKQAFSALAYSGGFETVTGYYQSWTSAVLRAATEIGLTVVESLGTLSFLDLGMRFGVDHLLSIAQRFPEGVLGLDFNFPERIVRLSTAAFADPTAQDLPPGLVGQMWIDFRILGPVVWGIVFGLQMSVLQHLFERTRRSLQSAGVFMLLVFVVSLALNTGSFDFTFSTDIFAVLFVLMVCVRVRREPPLAIPEDLPSLGGNRVNA